MAYPKQRVDKRLLELVVHALHFIRMRYKLVMFDFDGTLANTFPLFCELCVEITEKFALRRIAPHEIDTLRGLETSAILASLGVSRWQLPVIMKHARTRMAEQSSRIALFDGMSALLQELADAEVRLAVVSSNQESTVRTVLGDNLSSRVHHFACGVGLFGKARKVRGVVRDASRDTTVTSATSALVGDEGRDIEAASRAGVTPIAVTWGYATTEALQGAAVQCTTVEELRSVLIV